MEVRNSRVTKSKDKIVTQSDITLQVTNLTCKTLNFTLSY